MTNPAVSKTCIAAVLANNWDLFTFFGHVEFGLFTTGMRSRRDFSGVGVDY